MLGGVKDLLIPKYEKMIVFCDQPSTRKASSDVTGMTFRALRPEDFDKNAIFREKKRQARFKKRLVHGHRCFGFETESGEVASYLWLSLGSLEKAVRVPFSLGMIIELGKYDGYIWDCRTVPEYLRRGLYTKGLLSVLGICASSGKKDIFIGCVPSNSPSYLGIMSAGFRQSTSYALYRWANRCLVIEGTKNRSLLRVGEAVNSKGRPHVPETVPVGGESRKRILTSPQNRK